jgi:hypothetical protein
MLVDMLRQHFLAGIFWLAFLPAFVGWHFWLAFFWLALAGIFASSVGIFCLLFANTGDPGAARAP